MQPFKTRLYFSYFLAALVLFLIIFSVGNYSYNSLKEKEGNRNSQSTLVINKPDGKTTLRGMIWTAGLSTEEKSTLNIQTDYQLTKTANATGWEGKTDGVFLVNANEDLSKYLGKCVELKGNIIKGWEDIANKNYEMNGQWTYDRSAFEPVKIQTLDLSDCVADFDNSNSDTNIEKDRKRVSGTLFFNTRPAPDISYDIGITPDKPFIDEFSSAGGPAEVKKLDITAGTYEVYKNLLENIGNKVEVSGFMQWGYSESRYLQVETLTRE